MLNALNIWRCFEQTYFLEDFEIHVMCCVVCFGGFMKSLVNQFCGSFGCLMST